MARSEYPVLGVSQNRVKATGRRLAAAREAKGQRGERAKRAPDQRAAAQRLAQKEARTRGGMQDVNESKGQFGLSNNSQAGLGQQLSSRVSSGAISQEQAEQTAKERQMLEQAFGKDWRTKVFGGRGIMRANRKALGVGGVGHSQLEAFRKKLLEERQRAVQEAQQKLQE